ncbi:glutathione S-transferase family protein [Catenovulum sediminis]|uniref:Glutathione S-transferase family protein n=1 Tax=Catenovulum sediminis TaxID=1740262 RepID=A0ABV1RKK6_9ALTE|nr:glutathione S-transferase family protein [Catenovulum sediminis]
MSMVLYGSLPSPYVRRIRMLLEGQDYQFQLVNLYDDDARTEYSKIAPLKKMPMLEDKGQKIFDSHVIAQYVQEKFNLDKPSINDLNLVSAVDAVTDSLIILFYGKRSELEITTDKLIFQLQIERIPQVLDWLNEQAKQGAFDKWGYASICLLSLLDWITFRNLHDISQYSALLKVQQTHGEREIAKGTYPQ